MEIDQLEKVELSNAAQWILTRGKNLANPLILHVPAGPGLPGIPEANTMKKLLQLENDFLVSYWDQRGVGKSYSKSTDASTINFNQLAEDILACIRHLTQKYHKDKVILIGYSIGASLSLLAAQKDSSLISRIITVGCDIDLARANTYALNTALQIAKDANRTKLVRQIEALQNVSITTSDLFQQRAQIITNLGGIKAGSKFSDLLRDTITNMLFSKAYSLGDILKTIKGMEFSQNALLPELDTFNLFHCVSKIDIPIHFIQGKLDMIAPTDAAIEYYNFISAPEKSFKLFEHSAHMAQYEEPVKFRKLIFQYALGAHIKA